MIGKEVKEDKQIKILDLDVQEFMEKIKSLSPDDFLLF